MPRERQDAKAARAQRILDVLEKRDPDWTISLDFEGPFQLLVATILSAQSTDAMVNRITPALFAAYPTPQTMAAAPRADVERLIRSSGYFRQKARHIQGMARALLERHGGEVPRTMEALTALPGVGRKTANVLLHTCFGIAEGVCVDTHVLRLSRRLGLTRHVDPVKVERDLMALLPRDDWLRVTHLLIDHGRAACTARAPACARCVVNDLCPSAFKVRSARAKLPGPAPARPPAGPEANKRPRPGDTP